MNFHYKNSKIDRTDGTVIYFENKRATTLPLNYSTILYIVYKDIHYI